jgi:hypothetical protein
MVHMKNFIGGLFKNKGNAELARKALRDKGLDDGSIHMLQCNHEKQAVVLEQNPSIKSIGKGALTGALILGGIGAAIGLLVGLGVIRLPSLEPSASQALPFQITGQFILAATLTGVLLGALTGAILGAATRLAMPQYRKLDTFQQASKGDLLLAVQADSIARINTVKSTMQENGAFRLEEFKDSWDPEIWSVLNEETPQVR